VKILAIEHEFDGVTTEDFEPHLKSEAQKVWELYQQETIREIYFRADQSSAVLMLECDNVETARAALASLPMVKAKLIYFEIMPLAPYPGFERLFEGERSRA
jgi:muconolactone delta-isomerase